MNEQLFERRRWLLAALRAARSGPVAAALASAWASALPAPTPTGSASAPEPTPAPLRPRPLRFPADHGAHPDTHVEWWYVTGWLDPAGPAAAARRGGPGPRFGFQLTFFRVRTGLALDSPSRFAARQLLMAHAALTDTAADPAAPLRFDQRVAREGFDLAVLPGPAGGQEVRIGDWRLRRDPRRPPALSRLQTDLQSDTFGWSLVLEGTMPPVLQGDAGWSRKGPQPAQASFYYSEPQLRVRGRLARAGAPTLEVSGRAWLDHEWSDKLLAPEAVGWDWLGMSLRDGAALTAFRLRRADGTALWAGGSWRAADGTLRVFEAHEVNFTPLRTWTSPRTGARYPTALRLRTPAGEFELQALRDDQELDARASSGTVYWEGLAVLRRAQEPDAGWGYLEMTGYADRLRL